MIERRKSMTDIQELKMQWLKELYHRRLDLDFSDDEDEYMKWLMLDLGIDDEDMEFIF